MSNGSFLGFINKRLKKLTKDVGLDDSDLEFTDEEDLLDEEYEDDFKPLKEVGGKSEAEEELETAGTAEDEFEVEEEFEAEDEFEAVNPAEEGFETVYSAAGEPKAKKSDDTPAFLKPEPQVGKAGSISPAKKTTSSFNKDPRFFNSFLEREDVKWNKIIYFPPQKANKGKDHVFTIEVDNHLLNFSSYEFYQKNLKEALQGILDYGEDIDVTLLPSNKVSIVIPSDVNIAPLLKRLENSNIEFETSVIEEPKNDDLKKGAIKSDIPKMKTFKHSSVDVDERLQSIIAAAGKKESEEFQKKVNAARESIARIADRRTEIDEEFFPEETSSVVEEGATKTGETSGPEADTPSEEKKEEQKVEKLKAKKSTEEPKEKKSTEVPKVEKTTEEQKAKKVDERAPVVYNTNRSYFGTASNAKNSPNPQVEGSNMPKEKAVKEEETQKRTVSASDLARQSSDQLLRPGTTGFFNTSRSSKKSIDK